MALFATIGYCIFFAAEIKPYASDLAIAPASWQRLDHRGDGCCGIAYRFIPILQTETTKPVSQKPLSQAWERGLGCRREAASL